MSSCQKKDKIADKIIGTWSISSPQIINLDEFTVKFADILEKKQDIKDLKNELDTYYKNNFNNASIEFFADSTCTFNNDEEIYNWSYEPDSDMIVLSGKAENHTKIDLSWTEFKNNYIDGILKFNVEGVPLKVSMKLNKE